MHTILSYLGSIKAPINELNDQGKTPLRVAEDHNNMIAARLLLKEGALPDDMAEEKKLRELFVSSLAAGIDISISQSGARMWDIIENFAQQCMLSSYPISLVTSYVCIFQCSRWWIKW